MAAILGPISASRSCNSFTSTNSCFAPTSMIDNRSSGSIALLLKSVREGGIAYHTLHIRIVCCARFDCSMIGNQTVFNNNLSVNLMVFD